MENKQINAPDKPLATRLQSLDQFRGYSVAAMFVVNFVCGLSVTHHLLKHNNTHFSYADSIMPSFLVACGCSYRMSHLKRRAQAGAKLANWSIVRRSLVLIWLSAMLTAFNASFGSWSAMTSAAVMRFFAEFFKANLWEVLAIIGAVQILTLPIISKGPAVRALAIVTLGVLHTGLSWLFNEAFVYGESNWMDAYFGAAGKRAWDGGCFGLLSWAQLLLIGTLAYDAIGRWSSGRAAAMLILAGAGLMVTGYGMSCLTRLYEAPAVSLAADTQVGLAASPVMPDWSLLRTRSWRDLLAEPPFVPPPPVDQRAINYWMMDKRVVTQSFVFFSGGCALAVLGLFVLVCDRWQRTWGLFTTFGQNPLAGYIIHHLVAIAMWSVVPKDSPLVLVLPGLCIYFATTYLCVRFLEQRRLYLRL